MKDTNLKIGIDAKWYYNGPISGQVILKNVLPQLIKTYPEHQWHIFLDKKFRKKAFLLNASNVHLHYVWSGINMLSNFYILPQLAKKIKLDVVLYQTFAPKTKKSKSVAFIHDILFEEYPQFFTATEKFYFWFVKRSCSNADRIITTTETVKKDLEKFNYAGEQKIDIVPLGVSTIFKPSSEFSPDFLSGIKKKYQLPDNYLLFTGRLNARKNIESILKALPFVEQKIPIVIIGEKDWKEPKLKEHLKNINSRVQFIGAVHDIDLAAIYSMAKIFCFPSFAEGFGLPPLEALASGVPTIVSNTTSMPEVCGNAGIYVDPKNEKDIAEKINELLANKNFYDQKVKESLARAKQFTWQKTAEGIMKSLLNAV